MAVVWEGRSVVVAVVVVVVVVEAQWLARWRQVGSMFTVQYMQARK